LWSKLKSTHEFRRTDRLAHRLKQLEAWIMAGDENWVDIGSTKELSGPPLRRIKVVNNELAISLKDGQFGAVSNTCNHVGGPLGEGRLDGEYIVCPWHNWKFHRCSGLGEPGFERDRVPAYPVPG
jgi:nitrite reductase/ring-hydroxylating ferredoxin subunit